MFYAPYGAQTVTAGVTSDAWEQNPYGFKNGNRTDNGVLVKFGMRWYLAITGTWTQRDTLDAPLDPKNANRYGFAGDDPVNASDPTGRNTFTDYAGGCAVGTATSAGIALGLGTFTAGGGAALALAGGCLGGIASVAIDKYTSYGPISSYTSGLSSLNRIAKGVSKFL